MPDWVFSIRLPLAIFLGTFLGGELAVLAGVLLALAGALPVTALFAASLLGTLASDMVWFLSGERIVRFAGRWEGVQERFDRTLAIVDRVDRERRCRYLLYFKFVYGIRIVGIVYTAMRRISRRRFLFLDAVGSATYLIVLIGFGLVLCRQAVDLAPAAQAFRYGLAAAAALGLLTRLGAKWVRTRLPAG